MNWAVLRVRFNENCGWKSVGLAAVLAVHFVCFYWWVSGSYHFTGDGLFYFSRRIDSFAALWARFLSVDELYQYRPLPYAVFSFVLYPLFGTNSAPYHLTAYLVALVNALLAAGCCYFWLSRDKTRTLIALVFLLLNPVNFFPSYGLAYIDVLLSVLFYLLGLILILANTRWTPLLAPLFAVLALLSREHSVLLPAQALLILLATGVSLRHALARTRNVWLVLAAYAIFQLIIRQGAVFAPETASSNLKFGFSMDRVESLVKGIKPAIYFPESIYLNEFLHDYRRLARLAFVYPWLAMILWALYRRDKIALSGFFWVPLSLLPVAFIRFPVFPRHYYLALPGLAVLFVSAVRSTRVMAYVAAILSLVTLTSVSMYAQTSWIAESSRQTKKYFNEIQSIADRNGRSSFYVLNGGDPYFHWHIDGGIPVGQFLGKDISVDFAVTSTPLSMEAFLSNSVNVVIPAREGLEMIPPETGRFPEIRDLRLCGPVRRLTAAADCAVFFRGLPVEDLPDPAAAPRDGVAIFLRGEEIVTASRTTVFLSGGDGLRIDATLTVVPESADGVSVQIYQAAGGQFHRIFHRDIGAGGQIRLAEHFQAPPGSIFALRIGPGPNGDETGDRVVWKVNAP